MTTSDQGGGGLEVGGSPVEVGVGVLHDNDDDTYMTPYDRPGFTVLGLKKGSTTPAGKQKKQGRSSVLPEWSVVWYYLSGVLRWCY